MAYCAYLSNLSLVFGDAPCPMLLCVSIMFALISDAAQLAADKVQMVC
jgi:hypothetical protein